MALPIRRKLWVSGNLEVKGRKHLMKASGPTSNTARKLVRGKQGFSVGFGNVGDSW